MLTANDAMDPVRLHFRLVTLDAISVGGLVITTGMGTM